MDDLINWLATTIDKCFDWLWGLLQDFICWIFESFLNIVIFALNSISFGALNTFAPSGSLPSEIINIMGLLGVGAASSIILAATLIRLLLQLIPFVRLGS